MTIHKSQKQRREIILFSAAVCLLLLFLSATNANAGTVEEPQASVTWREVSQGINAAGKYVYDGTKTDSTMSDHVLMKSDGNWYHIENGAVSSRSGLYSNTTGWWNVVNGKVNTATGIIKAADGNWYCFDRGRRVFTANETVMKNENGWWYLADGKVDFSFTGIASNANGSWYLQGGKVNFDYSGTITWQGAVYHIQGGRVV